MRPRRTHESNYVFRLKGGNEDQDLWVQRQPIDDNVLGLMPGITSVWVPSNEERAAIAAGENIELTIVGNQQPPVVVGTTAVAIGKGPHDHS